MRHRGLHRAQPRREPVAGFRVVAVLDHPEHEVVEFVHGTDVKARIRHVTHWMILLRGLSTVSTMAVRFSGKAISGPLDPALSIAAPRELEPHAPDPRPERSILRGVQNLRSEALELPTPVPEHLASTEVRDPPKRR